MASLTSTASAQHFEFASDAGQRGYTDRPYLRYEAEPDLCHAWQGEILLPPSMSDYDQSLLQSEASRQCALSLVNPGDYVEWICDKDADGLTLRFSIPDSADGTGTKGKIALYEGSEKITDLDLDSYWAWQYTTIANTQDKYPDNTPSDAKFARMRFDEINVLLPKTIAAGSSFRLVKEETTSAPYTVDFVELEKVPAPVTYDMIEGEKVMFDPANGSLQNLINSNPGKTIYIPAGTYNIARRLTINADNTKLVGAGMWHTTLYFNASSDNRATFSQRGIESSNSGLLFQGFTLNTINNKRYFNNNSSMQVGKGFNGSLGSGSTIRDVRVDHFECGAWIADYSGKPAVGLLIENCRFRNNYADGINLSSGSRDCTVRHCSFRNNGDDDQAIWSSTNLCSGNLFEFNTAENNWRASSLGFFGGKNNKARNIYIADAMEEGARINGEFAGTGFSTEGMCEFSEITIERCGDKNGTPGQHGGFWGASCPSLHVCGGYAYNVANINISGIDIISSRWRGIGLSSNSGKQINNINLKNIHINGIDNYEYALYVEPGVSGYGTYENITWEDCVEPAMKNASSRFIFTETGDSGIETINCAGKDTLSDDFIVLETGNMQLRVRQTANGRVKLLVPVE